MVDQYLRNLKKKLNINNKKADLETIIKEQEVNLNELSDSGNSLLNIVIMEEDIDLLKLLLKPPQDFMSKAADPNIIDKKLQWSALVTAINQGPSGCQDAIFELLRAKADPNLEVQGKTPIMWAALNNQVDNIQVLTKYDGDINKVTDQGTALHMACSQDHTELVDYLLKQDIKVELQDSKGETALHICAINGSNNSLITIINHFIALIEESEESQAEQISNRFKSLLNMQNSLGNTVLHECALNERQILTQKLRRLSLIDDQLKNNEDKTALDIENTIKDEQFRDQIEKQKQITESKLRKKRIQEEKALIQDLQRKEEEELIEKERQEAKKQQKKGTHNPAAEAQRFRMFALLAFFLFLLAAYFILDFIAKSKEKTGPGSMRRERREGL
eukprot:403351555